MDRAEEVASPVWPWGDWDQCSCGEQRTVLPAPSSAPVDTSWRDGSLSLVFVLVMLRAEGTERGVLGQQRRKVEGSPGGRSVSTCPSPLGYQRTCLLPQPGSAVRLTQAHLPPSQAGCRSWPADWRRPTTWWARAQG